MLSRLLLLALLAASLWYFLRVVWRRLEPMRQAQPSLPFDQVGRRLWRVFAEVMLQTRVIGERPVAGFLHALVMWGFFAFAWVSIQHFWEGFVGLDQARPLEGAYAEFAAFWALAVLIGILGLAWRRFLVRPPALGPLSISSGIVAALIVLLMVTYLTGWRALPPGTTAWKVNWWLHTLSFLGMFLVIPHSKHLHLVLGPFAIFFRSETTSSMRALRADDDDDFGMLDFGDLSQKDILDVHSCVECGRCTEVCPANVIGGSLNPKEVILQVQRGLLAGAEWAAAGDRGGNGRGSAGDGSGSADGLGRRVAGTAAEVEARQAWVSEQDLYQCLSCGACEQACPVGIEHVGYKILDLRRGLVSEGRTHNEKLTELFTTMERAPHNPWGIAHDTRRKFIEADEFPIFDGSQDWLLWLGCGNSYDPHGQDVARAMKKILEAAHVSWGVLARETCCGEPARRAGNEYLYMELSEKVIESFREKRVRNVIVCCPHCTRMLDVDYRQNAAYEDLGIRVVHHTEFLDEVLPLLALKAEPRTVTYHDPCYLARGRNVTGQPRTVLHHIGARVVEMSHHGKRTFCCGAGGAQLYIADDKAELPGGRVNHKRFTEAAATGASTIAVACPYCPIMLKDAAQHAGREDVEVLDVAELVAERLG